MAEWQTVRYDPTYPEKLDAEIIPLCDVLNAAGFVTTASCCGHGGDWPRVWFEYPDDVRVEDMARYVMRAENAVNPYLHFTVFHKQVLLEGYLWRIEVHLTDIFGDTPREVQLQKAVVALGVLVDQIRDWSMEEQDR